MPSSTRYASITASPLRSGSGATSTLVGGSAHITLGHAGCRSNSSEPITMVQRSSSGGEERWHSAPLCYFRHLNMQMKKDSYPLHRIQEVLAGVGSAHFSSMDFESGFWQIKMAPESQQYTAFMVGNLRFYEFTHMLFRLCNAPATFQCLMQNTLGGLNLTYCVIYLDDVIIFGCTEEEHLEHLWVVFERFWEFNLKLKPSKSSFFHSEIIYLAHHVLQQGILPNHENMQAVEEFLMPETYTQVCAF